MIIIIATFENVKYTQSNIYRITQYLQGIIVLHDKKLVRKKKKQIFFFFW